MRLQLHDDNGKLIVDLEALDEHCNDHPQAGSNDPKAAFKFTRLEHGLATSTDESRIIAALWLMRAADEMLARYLILISEKRGLEERLKELNETDAHELLATYSRMIVRR
jgi:hypothetical protein